MKTANSVLCAVVVFVLGFSVALSAPHAFAASLMVYPADTCGKLPGNANITRNQFGGIANASPAAILFVSCGIVNDGLLKLSSAAILVTDRNPGPIISDDILCNLIQVRRIIQNSGVVLSIAGARTFGASNDARQLGFFPPFLDPNNPTGPASTNFITCIIPARISPGDPSEIHFYSVSEQPITLSQAVLPPEVQETQAMAVIEAQEIKLNQALTKEKEDPQWSQSAVTAWTQVFQAEGIKEELKGIQLDTIDCRTTLCRLKLTPTAPPQGDAVFGEDLAKLMLFAPWSVQGFGKIEHPGGQAPGAVLYIAREGHSLP
jgi:hypothetical protein